MKEKLIRYRPGVDPKPESRTDWARVDAMTEEEIEAAARDLFAREHECCAFFDFVVERQDAELIVWVEVPAGAEASLDQLVTHARSSAARTTG